MRSEDRELVERVLAGDRTAWQEWDARFRPVLAAIARREFRLPQEDIEDLLQDLALALLNDSGRQLRAYRQEAPLCSWLCAVCAIAALISSAAIRLPAARTRLLSRRFDRSEPAGEPDPPAGLRA